MFILRGVDWKIYMIMLYLLFMTFSPMGLKYGNTDSKSVLTATETMLKTKTHLVIFHESIYLPTSLYGQDVTQGHF